MMNNFNKILNELSYRVSSGIPDLTNEQHLMKLWDILKEHNWSIDARVELLRNLSGKDAINEAVFSPREMGTKQKYQPMWISTIENGEEFTIENPNGSVVLDKSNLNMKGFDNGKTLKQILSGGNKQDFENFFKKDGSFKPILKGKDGKLYALNQISKQTYTGKTSGGKKTAPAEAYEMGICMAHAINNKGMSREQAYSATLIDKSSYEKYKETVEPVGIKIAEKIKSIPLLVHTGKGLGESVINPYVNNTPKTDILGGSSHRISLKKKGGSQLMSGLQADTRGVFEGAKLFWSSDGSIDPLVNDIIKVIETQFTTITGDQEVGQVKRKFEQYYLDLRTPQVSKELKSVKDKLNKIKKPNSNEKKLIKLINHSDAVKRHIKVETSSLGLTRGSINPDYVIPGVSVVNPNKVSKEFQGFLRTYDNKDLREEAQKVLEKSIDIKNMQPMFDKIWNNNDFKKWAVYEASTGNYKFSGDSSLNSTNNSIANEIMVFDESGNVKIDELNVSWASKYSGKVKQTVGYKSAGRSKSVSFRMLVGEGVVPENVDTYVDYDFDKIVNEELQELQKDFNTLMSGSEILQEGFFDNLRKKGSDFIKGVKRAFKKLLDSIKNFIKKFYERILKRLINTIKQYAKQGFDFLTDSLGININGQCNVDVKF